MALSPPFSGRSWPVKDEWIAAFEANYGFALVGFFNEEGVQFVLRDGVVGGAFAGEDDFGFGRGKLEECGIAQGIVGDDLGAGE